MIAELEGQDARTSPIARHTGRTLSIMVLALGGSCVTRIELAPAAPDEVVVMGSVPDSVIERFAREPGGKRDEAALNLRYPVEGTSVPADLGAMRFAWDARPAPAERPGPMGMDEMPSGPAEASMFFELCLETAQRSVCVYTEQRVLDLDTPRWTSLIGADDGAGLNVRLRGLSTANDDMHAVPDRMLTVLAPTAAGTFYYWAEEHLSLRRARISVALPEVAEAPLPQPVTCSAISRDGARLAVAAADELRLLSLPSLELLWSVAAPLGGAAGQDCLSFDPTARRIAFARAGTLGLIDADSGALLTAVDLGGARVSHPDWSPDGRYLAVTLWPGDAMPDESELEGSSLARIPVAIDSALGLPEPLVSPTKRDETLAFPAYSRAGTWLAYVQLKGKLRDGKEPSLRVVAASSGSAPVALDQAGADKPKDERVTSPAAPAWLPSEAPNLEWLAFASSRPLGAAAPAEGHQQLWMVPVDESLAEQGLDPSRPAVWLPFQGAESLSAAPMFARD